MKLEIKRYIYNTDVRSTIGDLLIDGEWFCHTLEDEVRPEGMKIYGETAIPAGKYAVHLNYSDRFKKPLPLIFNTPQYGIEMNGVKFAGVRLHGGNTEEDTLGCPLVAFNTDGKKIWGSASQKLVELFEKNPGQHELIITNEPFSYEGKFIKPTN